MKKIGIFYGSTTGTCEELAGQLAEALGVSPADIHSADKMTAGMIDSYDILILGTSTWGCGEMQDDWYSAVKLLKGTDLHGKEIALFGCGDSASYSDTFCDGMGIIRQELQNTGCTFIADRVPTDDYSFAASVAVIDDCFIGLAIDEVNESDKTPDRIQAWVEELKKHL